MRLFRFIVSRVYCDMLYHIKRQGICVILVCVLGVNVCEYDVSDLASLGNLFPPPPPVPENPFEHRMTRTSFDEGETCDTGMISGTVNPHTSSQVHISS